MYIYIYIYFRDFFFYLVLFFTHFCLMDVRFWPTVWQTGRNVRRDIIYDSNFYSWHKRSRTVHIVIIYYYRIRFLTPKNPPPFIVVIGHYLFYLFIYFLFFLNRTQEPLLYYVRRRCLHKPSFRIHYWYSLFAILFCLPSFPIRQFL